jgi:hypothetical protein
MACCRNKVLGAAAGSGGAAGAEACSEGVLSCSSEVVTVSRKICHFQSWLWAFCLHAVLITGTIDPATTTKKLDVLLQDMHEYGTGF